MKCLDQNDKIFVAGSNGMVGSAICRLLKEKGYSLKNKNLLISHKKELDFKNKTQVEEYFEKNKPDIVINAAAKVGGILANSTKPVEFLLDNIKIQNNLIEASFKFGVKRFLFLGSSCIYPKMAKQPIKENYLLTDSLEFTNQWYAIAKIAGIKLCEAYRREYNFDTICLMPTNLYGPNDNYNLKNGHVMASLIRKFHEAKIKNKEQVICWGTGNPLREFLYVDDFAEACIFALNNWFPDAITSPKDKKGDPLYWLNIGSNFEISIFNLANKVSELTGFKGNIIWDKEKPDGTPRKKLETSKMERLGWEAKTDLNLGIKKTIASFNNELLTKKIRI